MMTWYAVLLLLIPAGHGVAAAVVPLDLYCGAPTVNRHAVLGTAAVGNSRFVHTIKLGLFRT